MMWKEFEEIAGYEVSYETYSKVIEPMYYAVPETMSKREFVKLLNREALEVKKERKPNVKKMLVRDRSGYRKTPNGCWYHVEYVDMIDVDVKTGKIVVAPLPDKVLDELSKTTDLYLSSDYDMDYTDCVDKKRKPITINLYF